MANETMVTVLGNIVRDPRMGKSGDKPVCNFTVAHTPRFYSSTENKWVDGATTYYDCAAWAGLASNCEQTLEKGMKVIVYGRLTIEDSEYTDKSGQTVRTKNASITVTDVGPSLVFATADVSKVGKGGGGQQARAAEPASSEKWDDEAPF